MKPPSHNAEYQRGYRRKNREKIRTWLRVWRAKNIEKDRGYKRKYALRTKYGLTPGRYAAMAAAQDHCCAVCGRKSPRGLHVDHNHATGKVRGLLCGNCNRALGLLGDSAVVIRKAAAYLEYYS